MKGLLRGIGYFILYLAVTVITQSAISMGLSVGAAGKGITNPDLIAEQVNNNLLGMTVISGLITGIVLYLVFKLRKKNVKQEWSMKRFAIMDLIKACLLAFSFSSAFSLLTSNIDIENSRLIAASAQYYSNIVPGLGMILMILNLLIIAPVVEEIALRGIVYTRIAKTMKPVVALIVSAVLFGLMHFMAGGIVLVVGATMMGLILGFLLYRYKSLWICIIAHICANIPDFIEFGKHITSTGMRISIAIAFGVVFAVALIWILKSEKRAVE